VPENAKKINRCCPLFKIRSPPLYCRCWRNVNTFTFTTPFHLTYRISQKARLARMGEGTSVKPPVSWVGVEALTVQDGGGDGVISFVATKYCWVKHVETVSSYGTAVAFKKSILQ
jgi:hypothetical protein